MTSELVDRLVDALQGARPHVLSQNRAEHMLDGFGPKSVRASDADLELIDRVLADVASAVAENFQPAAQIDPRKRKRRVVCAAWKMSDGTLVLGARHWDSCMIATADRLGKERSRDPDDQGFADQRGVFMDRREAWKVAEAAEQIIYRCGGDTIDGGTLYSENLY